MNTQNNTILITGGSAGIGYEMARQLSEKGNRVIITGRDAERLQQATTTLSNVTAITSDVADEADVEKLVATINADFPSLNILINNAGYAVYNDLANATDVWKSAQAEMHTNYISLIRLTEKLLPLLKQQQESAVVNVTSIVAYAPGLKTPTYSASKAAVHSYTKILRLALKDTPVKVFELMPPLVNTSFSADIGGATNGIAPEVVAAELLKHLERNEYAIHVGKTADIYNLLKVSPIAAMNALNGISE